MKIEAAEVGKTFAKLHEEVWRFCTRRKEMNQGAVTRRESWIFCNRGRDEAKVF